MGTYQSIIATLIGGVEYAPNIIMLKKNITFFYESDKAIFDLYAGQNVRNSFVEFEVVIYNVFISGRKAGDEILDIRDAGKWKIINRKIRGIRWNSIWNLNSLENR